MAGQHGWPLHPVKFPPEEDTDAMLHLARLIKFGIAGIDAYADDDFVVFCLTPMMREKVEKSLDRLGAQLLNDHGTNYVRASLPSWLRMILRVDEAPRIETPLASRKAGG